MKKVFLLAFAAAFTFAACNKDNKAEATEAATTEMNAEHGDHDGHDHAGHDHANEAQATAPTTQGTTAAAQDVKINPPHGQPGHRCEIPVGAPLDGSAAPAQQQVQAQPQTSNGGQGFLGSGNAQAQQAPNAAAAQQAPPAQQTAPGMQGKPNPAHGQPGHRCDVQVGQPLP